ncbi:MAG: glucans biosynthesis glucosyltransferase MdoH [Deltaproteobacteria bacterium]|nr:glucans biosynthesis glucosyltransferase MdoH [Deltaproteobacteria bacterium]
MPHAELERRFFRPRTEPDVAELNGRTRTHNAPRTSGASKETSDRRLHRQTLPWTKVAVRRRLTLAALVAIPSIIASQFMLDVLPQKGGTVIEVAIVLFFAALFGWISIGFWTALLGIFTLVRRQDRFAVTLPGEEGFAPIDASVRTAIVMPICEEPVERVFAGLRAIHDSLERTGSIDRFEFFVLSDSADPATAIREEEAWLDWCRETGGFGRIFYRRRRVRLKRKSGNVADFCRRWGNRYRYMIMLDADSVMSGDALVRLVQMMEKHPTAGMIQTAPLAVYRRSMFGRVQQFTARAYGPMFCAGLHYWQLGDGQYWGHNTIIRCKPFADHCGLPPLPGKPPLGGDILSHDFVEAALMGRAGWTIWLAFDLPGSYEETPSSLLEEMKRDRRWCQGNLQHVRLLFTEGLFGAHRALFLNGALSYVSALLWFCFLLLSTAEAIQFALRTPEYFPPGPSLFPQWPVWRPDWALMLLAATCLILFLPKILSIAYIIFKTRTARAFGGVTRLLLSVPLEIVLSSLFAPIRMLFHTKFVLLNLLGRTVGWKSQPREDAETTWREAATHHGLDTVFATVWATALYGLSPDYFWWVMPVVGALILSVPISVMVSKIGLGDSVRGFGLFTIPEETDPPRELREVEANLAVAKTRTAALPPLQDDGFVRAVVDPMMNAVHRALLGKLRSLRPDIAEARGTLLDQVLAEGPGRADSRSRKVILNDPSLMDSIHRRLWQHSDAALLRRWGIGD